ncbi:DNA-binding transcriptional regulator YhcF (GntR family) [Paenibacillus forsythiae]|uniref:DNA-binding transcriptional regulator YhcF (GntR family) n=1 Tax=Paenibacillus forsythiae TaxID=365616 RepID=A0ABU3HDK6_9BACL|nr:GntR family transcriptional regulator [Paenibacillus forsythiae]MDT3428886.1 DNA-binding transcriptional regulator YhcF (GntR family) [Paenibacillus forsythiae]
MIITLDFKSETPVYVQLRNAVVVAIGRGDLKDGEKLPTIRQLAQELGINAMTVNKAFAIMKKEGFITIDRRHGAMVTKPEGGNTEYREKLEQELTLVISEASLKGVGRKEFLDTCSGIFAMLAEGQRPVAE